MASHSYSNNLGISALAASYASTSSSDDDAPFHAATPDSLLGEQPSQVSQRTWHAVAPHDTLYYTPYDPREPLIPSNDLQQPPRETVLGAASTAGSVHTRFSSDSSRIALSSPSAIRDVEQEIAAEPALRDPSPRALDKGPTMMPFIESLRRMLANEEAFSESDVLRWDEAGTTFLVRHKSARLLGQVFSDAFGHSKYASFSRQLNVYGFTRSSNSTLTSILDPSLTRTELKDFHGWSHPSFYRGVSLTLPPNAFPPLPNAPRSSPALYQNTNTFLSSERRPRLDREAEKAAAGMRPRESKKRRENKRLRGVLEGRQATYDAGNGFEDHLEGEESAEEGEARRSSRRRR